MKKQDKKTLRERIAIILILVGMVASIVLVCVCRYNNKAEEVSYTQFLSYVEENNVKKVNYNEDTSTVTALLKDGSKCKTANPKYTEFKKDMLEQGVEVKEVTTVKEVISGIMPFVYILLLGSMLYFAFEKVGGGSTKFDNEEGSEIPSVTLDDVKGQDEVKADLAMYIDFLKNPEKYKESGGEMPKGILLYGPPGTGKTLFAKAVAGEAGVPFKAVNASDFDEIYQGVGSQRVRKLFKWAKEHAPCILFIDEIDAVGCSRGQGTESKDRQTLNALLAEMDGFDGSNGVFIIAATNRKEDLDSALIRAKRFDHHFAVNIPSTAAERREIIDYYTRNKQFAEDVDFDKLAKDTIGCSPATIDALINDASLIAAYKGLSAITAECIDEAWYKETMQGHAKKKSDRNAKEIELTAWHEAGHALMAMICGKDVRKVTIVPSTSGAGGFTSINRDKIGMYSRKDLENEVAVLYAGRVAEEILSGIDNVTTGASSDITQASNIIIDMIKSYGMSTLGLLDCDVVGVEDKTVCEMASKMSKSILARVRLVLGSHKDKLEQMASLLEDKETVSGDELKNIVFQREES